MVAEAFTRFATVGSCKPLASLFIFNSLREVCYLKALPAMPYADKKSVPGGNGRRKDYQDWSCGAP